MVQPANVPEMLLQAVSKRVREHHPPVLLSLAATNRDLPTLEIDVLDAQLQALLESQTSTIKQRHDKATDPGQLLENGPNFGGAQDDRYPLWCPGSRHRLENAQFNAQYVPVQEQNRAQRLVLCRRRHPPLHCQPRQKSPDLDCAKLGWMPLAVEHDEPPDPMDVDFLRPRL